jgi:glycosyltransferase involved in cell wall biosynthesis
MSGAQGPVTVSVVVPFRNAGRYIRALMESLAGQQCSGSWELVAVDNRSTDRTKAIIEHYATEVAVRVVGAPRKCNPSYARNVGAKAAVGTKLLFVDADDQVAPGYLAAMADALNDHQLVTSRVDSMTLNPEWVRAAQGDAWQEDRIAVFFNFLPATGVNIGIRACDFDRLGGFPEAFSGSEDVAFSWTAYRQGLRPYLVPDAIYRYRYRDTPMGLFRQSVNWGRDNALLYKRFRHAGMPGRPLSQAWTEWRTASTAFLRSRGRAERAPSIVRLGFCVGRLKGSVVHRVPYY